MKKLLLATLLIGMMDGCTEPNVEKKSTEYVVSSVNSPLKILNIDSCQYLFGEWGNATVLTHKGNCDNPIHKGGNK